MWCRPMALKLESKCLLEENKIANVYSTLEILRSDPLTREFGRIFVPGDELARECAFRIYITVLIVCFD